MCSKELSSGTQSCVYCFADGFLLSLLLSPLPSSGSCIVCGINERKQDGMLSLTKMYSFLDVFINFHRLIAKISAQDIKIAVIPCLGTLSTLVSYDSISQGQDYCDFICMPGSGLHPYQIIFTDISCSFYNLNAFKDHNSYLCHSHIVRAMGKPFSIMM